MEKVSYLKRYQRYLQKIFFINLFIKNLNQVNETIDGLKFLNDPVKDIAYFDNRFYINVEAMTYIYEKIDLYFYLFPHNLNWNTYKKQYDIFFVLSFHPYYNFSMNIRYYYIDWQTE